MPSEKNPSASALGKISAEKRMKSVTKEEFSNRMRELQKKQVEARKARKLSTLSPLRTLAKENKKCMMKE